MRVAAIIAIVFILTGCATVAVQDVEQKRLAGDVMIRIDYAYSQESIFNALRFVWQNSSDKWIQRCYIKGRVDFIEHDRIVYLGARVADWMGSWCGHDHLCF